MSERGPRVPNLQLDRVHARDAAAPGGRARGSIAEMTASLGAGVHAFLGAPEDGLIALADVLAGARRPTRGQVRVAGVDPSTTPSIRARIGALGHEPRLPPSATVGGAIRLALQARGELGHRIDAVLDPFGLGALHARSPRTLSFAEARAVELCLALTTPAPLLVVLYEPLADMALPEPERVRLHLRDLARAGACVVVATSSPADAKSLAEQVYVLHQGLVVRKEGGEGHGLTLGDARLRAWIGPVEPNGGGDVRALAAALSAHPEVRAVSWEDAPSASAGVALLELRAATVEACSAALMDAALESGATITAFAPAAPDLAEVRAATDTLLRFHWTAMRAAQRSAPAPAPVPAPVPEPPLAPPEPEPTPPPGETAP